MYTLIAAFEYGNTVETVVGEMLSFGIEKADIFIIPLDKRAETARLFDSMHSSDGRSLVDLAAILATLGMLFGTIYGFLLQWGPILWALIGFATGGIAGFLIDYMATRSTMRKQKGPRRQPELLVFVRCPPYLLERVERLMWEHRALSMAKLKRGPDAAIS